MPYFIFLFICVVWSASFLLMKKSAVAFSPVSIGAWRVVGGAAILAVVWWWHGQRWTLSKRHAAPLVFVVVVGFAWPFCIQPWVIARHGSALMAMLVGFVPLATILISLVAMGVVPSRRQAIGVAGALVCLGLLLADGWRRAVPGADLALAVTVPLGYAAANIVIRRWLGDLSSLAVTLASLVLSSFMLLPLAAGATPPPDVGEREFKLAVLSLGVLSLVGTGLATYLFNKLIREHGPLFAGMTTNVVPLGAVLWGWLDAETVTPLQLVALAGVVSMVALVQYRAAGAAEALSPPERIAPPPTGAAH
jgi:drug/metabolite transporter (DMT)-like permease